MSRNYKIFGYVKPCVVGSMKEGTKVGDVDEADMTLILDNEEFEKYFEFDAKHQRINVKKIHYKNKGFFGLLGGGSHLKLRSELKPFIVTSDDLDRTRYHGYIDAKKFFFTFVEEFYKIVSIDKTLADIFGNDNVKLSTSYSPCDTCADRDNVITQYNRCRHEQGCLEHQKTKENKEYMEKCDCKIFTSPCLSYSKIGLVLHLEFDNADGTKFNLDVDVCPPTFPVSSRRYTAVNRTERWTSGVQEEPAYDGSNRDKRAWLERTRPVNWLEEWIKSEDMSEATSEEDSLKPLKRSVQFRFFNNRDVTPEQVIFITL